MRLGSPDSSRERAISESFRCRAKTQGPKDQDYGAFAHRNPLLWLG